MTLDMVKFRELLGEPDVVLKLTEILRPILNTETNDLDVLRFDVDQMDTCFGEPPVIDLANENRVIFGRPHRVVTGLWRADIDDLRTWGPAQLTGGLRTQIEQLKSGIRQLLDETGKEWFITQTFYPQIWMERKAFNLESFLWWSLLLRGMPRESVVTE